ncbi:geopeptide radical SAM maturase [Trichlorobacter ammonificans]|uniref:Geopeptide radical SAM maturase n=1 Tax=Trichlorobacter ammonificans TaxID=2916410 RepID=A0ABM9D6V3_9BACT|nr:geopeptide radical SAM maturase [Trichlorobacter ammonificans]CAH2030164.1 Putative geopeptide radical SAM maturase [Trichlorobacter ammonificans]
MELSRYLKIFPPAVENGPHLLYSTLRGALLHIPAELLAALQEGSLEPEEQELLARLGILVPDALAERERLRGFFAEAEQRSDRFTYVVTLNLDCNLACPYCYEDHFRGRRYMSDDTASLLIDAATGGPLARGRNLRTEFYGGEPLLSLPLLCRIAAALQRAAAEQGLSYSFMLVTNGTLLTRQVVEELLPLGLAGARVTLDGPPDIHNRQRPFVSGQGSFERILDNLADVCDLTAIQLNGNYTRENYRRFPELLDLLPARGLTPDKLRAVTFNPVTPTAGEAGLSDFSLGCACMAEPWLIEAGLFLRGEILKRGYHTPRIRFNACVVEFESDLVVNYDGSLYRCPAFMGWNDLCIGSLAEGVKDYRDSHRLGLWQNDECLDCPYLPLCFGGCRFLRRLRTGAIDGVDCRRDYLDAALERLLRQDLEQRDRQD